MPNRPINEAFRCVGTSRQTGERCRQPGVPFTDPPRCRFHGGHLPSNLATARERARQYELGMLDPQDHPWVREQRLRKFYESEDRRARRAFRKGAGLTKAEAEQIERQEAQRLDRMARDRAAKEKRATEPEPEPVQPLYDSGPDIYSPDFWEV